MTKFIPIRTPHSKRAILINAEHIVSLKHETSEYGFAEPTPITDVALVNGEHYSAIETVGTILEMIDEVECEEVEVLNYETNQD